MCLCVFFFFELQHARAFPLFPKKTRFFAYLGLVAPDLELALFMELWLGYRLASCSGFLGLVNSKAA